MPDPLIFAVLLTFVTFILGMTLTSQTPMQMLGHWESGFWALLTFAMQMVLIIVTGSALAQAPVCKKALVRLAAIPKTTGGAIVVVTLVAIIAGLINWGFGLVIAVLFAKEIAKVADVDYRLTIASAFSGGAMVSMLGLSGTIPLMLASPTTNFAAISGGVLDGPIPLTETTFATYTLVFIVIFAVAVPLINRAMHPKDKKDMVFIDKSKLEEENVAAQTPEKKDMTPAEKLENSRVISYVLGAMGLVLIVRHFMTFGFLLTLDFVNFMFLFVAIILHGTPASFLRAVNGSIRAVSGVVIQFPFYAGIMGMVNGANAVGVSLAAVMTSGFITISNDVTLPLFTFISAGILNMFIPSGGGQFVVQAPIMLPAAYELGADVTRTAMAIAFGDLWTNSIQPFWALPALAIAGLRIRDIMGFLIIHFFFVGILMGLSITFLPA